MIQALSHSATKVHRDFHHNNPRSAEVKSGRDAGHDYANTLLWPSLPCVLLRAGDKWARAQLDGGHDGKIMSNTGFKFAAAQMFGLQDDNGNPPQNWPSWPWPFC